MEDETGRAPLRRNFVYDAGRWAGFAFRDDDIVISTPPKCGTTWMQMLCALAIFRTPELPAPLAVLSPWLDMTTRPLAEVLADLDAQTHRRFIKTHTPLDLLPWDDRVTYVHVARDPRDVALSWDNHVGNLAIDRLIAARAAAVGLDDLAELGLENGPPSWPDDPVERFWQWVEVDGGGFPSSLSMLVHLCAGFWAARERPNVHLFHYSDLRADLAGEMARLAGALGVEPPTPELVEAARFERMKQRADVLVPNSDVQLWRANTQFFDRARSGDWRRLIGDEGLPRYEAALRSLTADTELAAWLHSGWRGGVEPARQMA